MAPPLNRPMNPPPDLDDARAVADAVLFEGYLLYPYRASATKNRMRWQFGVLAPRGAQSGDPSAQRTELLLEADDDATLDAHVRFLHLETREAEDHEGDGGWDEGDPVEHVVTASLADLLDHQVEAPIALAAGRRVRHGVQFAHEAVAATVRLSAERIPGPYGLLRVRVDIENTRDWIPGAGGRDAVMRCSLIGTHTLVAVRGGKFLSLLEPPEWAGPAVEACVNEGAFPVLVGADDDIVLSSPIILYDRPQIAPESAGQLFDATEIDEILTLRTLALTDAEKDEARGTDPRAAEIIDRVDDMPAEVLERLHGAIRSLREVGEPAAPSPPRAGEASTQAIGDAADVPWWDPGSDVSVSPDSDAVVVAGVAVRRGSRVRLHPGRAADAQDMFWAERIATVAAVLHDVEDHVHVAVVPVDDPGADLREWQGRYLYFDPAEIEPLPGPAATGRTLVAGIGNVFFGDDGFGVAVAQGLASRPLPEGVEVVDVGIRGVHLAYQLLDGYDLLVLVDATARGLEPGTVSVIEPDVDELCSGRDDDGPPSVPVLDAHRLDPVSLLVSASAMGARAGRTLVVACEPSVLDDGIGLSPPVREAVGAAIDVVLDLLLARDGESRRFESAAEGK